MISFGVNEVRTPLKLPPAAKEQAQIGYVRTSARDKRPFPTMKDFWFASVAWAVANNLGPAASGEEFVSAGIGPESVQLRPDQVPLLVAVFLRHHHLETLTAAAETVDASPLDLNMTARDIVEFANRLAAAGAQPLLDVLTDATGTSNDETWAAAKILIDLHDRLRERARERLIPLTTTHADAVD